MTRFARARCPFCVFKPEFQAPPRINDTDLEFWKHLAGWRIATTEPIVGLKLKSYANMNIIC